TLLMALPNENQLKFNSYKNAKSLMEAVEKSTNGTNEAVKTAHGVFAANSKDNASTLPNVDSLRDVVIYSFFASQSNSSQLDNEDLKQIDPDDLEEMDLKAPKHQDNRNREITRRTVPVEETTDAKALVAQDGFRYDWSDQDEEGPTNFALMAYTSSSSSSSDTELRKKFEKAEKERDDLKLTLEKFENSSKNLSKLLDSQVCDKFKTGVGYYSQVLDSQVFDSQVNDKYKTGEGYHAVPPPYTGNFMPLKPDLVLADKDEYIFIATSEVKTSESKPKSVSEPLIEDWISDSENENETKFKSKQRKPSFAKVEFVKSNEHVKSPRESVKKIRKKLMVDLLPLEEIPKEVKSLVKVKSVQFCLLTLSYMYSIDLKNVIPQGGLTCLFAKATLDESNLWHRRLGHINFKTMNKLVRGNLVRGLPSKNFENDHTCVACQKGKQHKASCKTKTVSSISQPLQMLHMDLFGLTFVKSIMKKMYCLVVTDDYSRFSWVFFLATKDETSGILKAFITGIENLIDHKVKIIIRCDNGTEFKNKEMNQFCEMKGIKREFSVARTPQQNRVAKRKNKTLIEAARTMLADSKLPTTFWAEAVNTAC
ncbi:putative ribonuclease H-like domain-containing protein, partial [Tanacetum coccineum]